MLLKYVSSRYHTPPYFSQTRCNVGEDGRGTCCNLEVNGSFGEAEEARVRRPVGGDRVILFA